jgi:acetyl-CoA carboxylase biotin carboxylase subunit
MKPIQKILVANRGEIAVRIFATVSEMGIGTVAVYSDADKNSLHVKVADDAICIGGTHASESYLVQDKIIAAAKQSGADAIHPGYGFLSENASFAKRCKEEGITFIGPSHEAIEKLGSKIGAKEIMKNAGVPVVPGYNGDDQNFARFEYEAEEIGYPVLLKASAGGGGKGMRIVNKKAELKTAFEAAQREAEKSFGDGKLLMEKYFPVAKHIEFQIFGDAHGNYVHFGERECSLQRRYQKVIEEAPSPSLNEDLRSEMGEAAVAAARAVNYTNAGTVEFLLDEKKNFYFLEVNTRLQVEHPVTEMIALIDLVRLQIQVAEGQPFSEYILQRELTPMHSIECRICAEDPANNFFPSSGNVLFWKEPIFDSIRLDTGVETGSQVGVFYDSMLAKLIVVEESRSQAIRLMSNALRELCVLGITTNKDFLQQLIVHPKFVDGSFDTRLIEREFSEYSNVPSLSVIHEISIAALLYNWNLRKQSEKFSHSLNGWRNVYYAPQTFSAFFNEEKIELSYRYLSNNTFEIYANNEKHSAVFAAFRDNELIFILNDHTKRFFIAKDQLQCFIQHPTSGTFSLKEVERFALPENSSANGGYSSPMPGEIIRVLVKPGDKVQSGKGLVVMSSMKMETTIESHTDGEVEEVFVSEKSFVEAGTLLLKIKEE